MKLLTVISGNTPLVTETANFLSNVIPIVVKMNGDAVSGNVLRYMYVGVREQRKGEGLREYGEISPITVLGSGILRACWMVTALLTTIPVIPYTEGDWGGQFQWEQPRGSKDAFFHLLLASSCWGSCPQ